MDQTVLVFHIVGLAIVLQLHMEVYVYRKKTRKARQCPTSQRETTCSKYIMKI